MPHLGGTVALPLLPPTNSFSSKPLTHGQNSLSLKISSTNASPEMSPLSLSSLGGWLLLPALPPAGEKPVCALALPLQGDWDLS